jgi:hypothetical protein
MQLKTLPVGVAIGLGLWLAAGAASADIVKTYDFTGTLANLVNGGTSVTGEFTLDQTTGTLGDYSFDTPAGVLDAADTVAAIATFSPAESPAVDFTELYANSTDTHVNFFLVFQTDLSSLSGSSFYIGPVNVLGGTAESGLTCQGLPECGNAVEASVFTSGEATLALPEPATWALMMAGVFGLGVLMRAERSRQAERAI